MNKTARKLLLIAAGAALAAQSANASITYADGDMLLGFRKAGDSQNLQVDLGNYSQFTSLYGSGTVLDLSSKFSLSEITSALGSFNSVSYSITGALNVGDGATYGDNSLWLTRVRSNPATQSTPLVRSFADGNTASTINTVLSHMGGQTGTSGHPDSALVVSSTSPTSYETVYGTTGKIGGNWATSTEATTSSSFTSGSSQRLDLYELLDSTTSAVGTAGTAVAGTGNGLYLGYFQMNGDGSLTFTAVPEASTYAAFFAGGLMLLALAGVHRKSLA